MQDVSVTGDAGAVSELAALCVNFPSLICTFHNINDCFCGKTPESQGSLKVQCMCSTV